MGKNKSNKGHQSKSKKHTHTQGGGNTTNANSEKKEYSQEFTGNRESKEDVLVDEVVDTEQSNENNPEIENLEDKPKTNKDLKVPTISYTETLRKKNEELDDLKEELKNKNEEWEATLNNFFTTGSGFVKAMKELLTVSTDSSQPEAFIPTEESQQEEVIQSQGTPVPEPQAGQTSQTRGSFVETILFKKKKLSKKCEKAQQETEKCRVNIKGVNENIEKYTTLSNDILQCCTDLTAYINKLKGEVEGLQEEKTDLAQKCTKIENSLNEKNEEIIRLNDIIQSQKQQTKESSSDHSRAINDTMRDGFTQGEKQAKKSIFDNLKIKFKDMVAETAKTLEEGLDSIGRKIAELKEREINQNAEIDRLKIVIEEKDKENANLKTQNEELSKTEAGQLAEQLKAEQQKISDLEVQLSKANGETQNVQRELEDKSSKLNDANKNIETLTQQAASAQTEYENSLRDKDEKHRKDIEELNRKKTEDLNKRDAQHKADVAELNNKHKGEVDELNKTHDTEIEKLKADHKAACESLIVQLKEVTESLNNTVEQKDAKINELNTTLGNEVNNFADFAIKLVEGMLEVVSQNAAVHSCSDDYEETAAGKNKELANGAQNLVNDIKNLGMKDTPSAWEEQLKNYLVVQLEKSSSFVSTALRYNCLSRLPFMIDAHREEGMCFDRKVIRQLYDKMVKLLGICRIAPNMPLLFVENVGDGEYEEYATFNDVEAFCPGSIKDHINNVERSAEELVKLIVGVSTVGYTLPDGTIKKSKVIV